MKFVFGIFLLILASSKQFTLDKAEPSDGIIYTSFIDVHIETNTKILLYTINLYQINYLRRHKEAIINKCKNNEKMAKTLEKQIYILQSFENHQEN